MFGQSTFGGGGTFPLWRIYYPRLWWVDIWCSSSQYGAHIHFYFRRTDHQHFHLCATPAFGAATSTPSLFGAPAATSTPSFGGGGGSLFGAPAASTSTSSLFGAPAAQPAASTAGAFPFSFSGGAAAPAAAPATGSAFSFGGASAPAFGAAPTSSAFGAAPSAGTSAFGGGGGGGMFGAPATGGVQGTTIAAYAPTTEKDTASNTMVTIHNISAMPQYKDKSFEELRWEDYQLGRKGQGMGQAAAGGMFGSAAPAAGTSLFGAPAGGSAFSTTSAPSTGSSLFGAPAASTGSLFGGGAATGSSLFGASAPATGTTSLFGAPAASAGTTSLFGATTSAPTTTSSLFGGGTSAFGAPTGGAATSSLFPSFTGTTAAAPASSAFSFGGATTSAAAPSTGGLFGSTTPSTSLFGTSTTADTSSSLFGGGTSSLFGGAGTGAATASTSLFGAPAASTGSSLFGATTPSTGGGLFGAPAASTGTGGGGLFGGSSLFGGSTPSTPSATSTTSFPSLGGFGAGTSSSLFGAPAASTGSSSLFGGATTGGTGLFPGFGTSTPSAGLGSLGGTGVPGAGTLVATIDSPRPYGSLPPLPPLTDSDAALASAAQTRAALAKPKHYKLTARSPAAGRSLGYYQNLGAGAASKRISFMGEIERKDLTAASPLGSSASTPDAFTRRKLILETDENVAMPEISEFRVTGGTPLVVDRRSMADLPPHATPYAPSAAPEQAAGVVERERVTPTIQIQPATPSSPVVGLYPTLPAREIQQSPQSQVQPQSQAQAQQAAGDTPLPARTLRKPVAERPIVNYDQLSRHVRDQDRKRAPVDEEVERLLPRLAAPGYWMEPSLDELRHMTKAELGRVEGLVVGREGYGQIEFLEPVDVRGADLNQLIVIDRHLITVFPDDATKPPRGQGLNVRARLTIEEAWPEHRDAESLEEYEAFLRKRGSRRKQRFVAYDRQRGAWTFDVPGF